MVADRRRIMFRHKYWRIC